MPNSHSMDPVTERVERARQLLGTAKHAAMATVNNDDSPHNTPFFFIIDEALEYIYWASSPTSLHSQNIERTGQLFVVIYESGIGGGLYIKCENGHELSSNELKKALRVHNAKRQRDNKPPLDRKLYSGKSPQRMYGAKLVTFWVNLAERNAQGNIIRDYRHEIQRANIQL